MSATATEVRSVSEQCRQARIAGRRLAALDSVTKDAALNAIAAAFAARISSARASIASA
ncbi:MAG: hypothetical protein ITG02_10185, partial [Patulibacter sp.]|nr:hypothetical protein [Patulibacter sp.]